MSTTTTVMQSEHDSSQPTTSGRSSLAFCLPSMPSDALEHVLGELRAIFPAEQLMVASPDFSEEQNHAGGALQLLPYPVQRNASDWVLNAADYLAASRLAQQRTLSQVVLLGTDAASLNAEAVRGMRDASTAGADLVVPRYHTGPQQGLVNSALLYPISRALFGVDIRFPLPLDAALSQRMLSRLGVLAGRTGNDGGLLWPVSEAALAGFSVREVENASRTLPRPQESDLNILLPAVAASLFTDVEAKAAYWQRARPQSAAAKADGTPQANSDTTDLDEIRSLVEGFRLAFANLRDIWSLVLPPQSLLALKRLSLTPAESFSFAPNLWARVVYDFALAFRTRVLNRGHLLGAMTPLYLAWVASLLRSTGGPVLNDSAVENTARAFEQEKPYLVSRWRWPDRFNP